MEDHVESQGEGGLPAKDRSLQRQHHVATLMIDCKHLEQSTHLEHFLTAALSMRETT